MQKKPVEADSIVPCNWGKAQSHSLKIRAQSIGKEDNEKYDVFGNSYFVKYARTAIVHIIL